MTARLYLVAANKSRPSGQPWDFDYYDARAVSRRRDLGPEMKEAANGAASHSPPP